MGAKVIIRREDAILRVTLNRPDKKNALDREMYEALIEALAQADADQSLRVVFIESAGDAFTAGNDLNDFRQAIGRVEDFPAFRFVRALACCDTPIVAAVRGDAVGVGTTMLLHCDLVYAATNARFKMPFVDLGLPPEAAASLLAPQRMGLARAAQYLLLCESFDAQEAQRMGVVNALAPLADLERLSLDAVRRLAQKPRDAVAVTRRLLRGDRAQILARIDEEGAAFAKALASAEARARLEAFFGARGGDNR
jgi:enoyl-CoA hydratase/carnithine racemase